MTIWTNKKAIVVQMTTMMIVMVMMTTMMYKFSNTSKGLQQESGDRNLKYNASSCRQRSEVQCSVAKSMTNVLPDITRYFIMVLTFVRWIAVTERLVRSWRRHPLRSSLVRVKHRREAKVKRVSVSYEMWRTLRGCTYLLNTITKVMEQVFITLSHFFFFMPYVKDSDFHNTIPSMACDRCA